jgi:hypothetical protein
MKKSSFTMNRHFIARYFLGAVLFSVLLSSCKKEKNKDDKSPHASSYSAEVLDKWLTMQLRLMRNATGISNHGLARHFAYSGVAALEAIAPGMPGGHKWSDQWNGLSLPAANHSVKYYYPASVNAALASINKSMFPAASAADKAAIDSLEAALNAQYLSTESQASIEASASFGKAIATAVFNWSETDGYKNASAPYTPPTGPGMWKPTAPAFAPPVTPYWKNNRPIIAGSTANTHAAAPPVYSTDPSSEFYKMVKQVYDASQVLTEEQKAMAIFWRDVPGPTSPGHWISILQQLVHQSGARLDKAALAYALTGVAGNDALIACFETKYQYTLLRPVTYIREVMGHTTWNPYIGTPAHPEYSSSHSALSSACAAVLQKLFGNVSPFTDRTNDYLGLAPRTYSSLTAIGDEASQSRLYAGIHYQPSINAGKAQGKKVVENIFGKKQ